MTSSLDRDAVVDAGVRVASRSGWAAVSMRAVAAELGVTAMALYRHVDDGASLRVSVVERVVAVLAPQPASDDLTADLEAWGLRLRNGLAGYAGLAGHLIATWFDSPTTLEHIDEMLGRARRAGHGGFEAVAIVNAVFVYALMRCEAERTVRSAGAVRRRLRTAGASRPLEHLTDLAGHYATAEFDLHFEFGLRALIAGMPTSAPITRRPRQ